MYRGSFNFPVTKRDRRNVTHLGGFPWISVTPTPIIGKYCQLTNGVAKSGIAVFVDPAFIAESEDSKVSVNSSIRMTDKNALVSLMGSIDFAESVFNNTEPGTRRPTPIYITLVIPSTLDAKTLGGTSFGLALTLSLCGFQTPRDPVGNILVCATGFVSNIGNPYQGIKSLENVLIDGIDSAEEKIAGCMKAGIDIIVPYENVEQILHSRTGRNEKTGQVEPYGRNTVKISDLEMEVVKHCGVVALKYENSCKDVHYAFAPHLVIEAILVLETYYGCRSATVSLVGKEGIKVLGGV